MNTVARKLSSSENEENSGIFVIIPVKKLSEAKSRLSPLLSENERKEFCLKMLEDVLAAIAAKRGIYKTIVVSRDPRVLQVAKKFHVFPYRENQSGLNQAISEAIDYCISMDAEATLILPSDIPLVSSEDVSKILAFDETSSVVICPSRGGNGTNALLLNPPKAIIPLYGENSFQRYINEASKQGISFRVYRSPRIALDIDNVEDLADFFALNAEKTRAYRFLAEIDVPGRLESNGNL